MDEKLITRYKGMRIIKLLLARKKTEFMIDGPLRKKLYPSLAAAKTAIDAWEKMQYKKDKRVI